VTLEPGRYVYTAIGPAADRAFGAWRAAHKSHVAILELKTSGGAAGGVAFVDYLLAIRAPVDWPAELTGIPTRTDATNVTEAFPEPARFLWQKSVALSRGEALKAGRGLSDRGIARGFPCPPSSPPGEAGS